MGIEWDGLWAAEGSNLLYLRKHACSLLLLKTIKNARGVEKKISSVSVLQRRKEVTLGAAIIDDVYLNKYR